MAGPAPPRRLTAGLPTRRRRSEAPQGEQSRPRYKENTWRLSDRRREDYRLVVLFLAHIGVRFGELAALRVGRLDFARRRAVIAESVTLVGSRQVFGTPEEPRAAGCPFRRS